MSQKYRHRPLDGARSIRVLELQPANDLAAPITCRLLAISLDDYPQYHAHYTALSYTWNNQQPSRQVFCDGKSLLITPNCDAAMRQLRSAEEIQILWIDSICIDQTEEAIAERNVQVALMGHIYKSAAKVVVWLGESNPAVESAMQKLMEIPKLLDGLDPDRAVRANIQPLLVNYAQKLSNNVKRQLEDPFRALFECSWWYRMWTIQEVALSFVDRLVIRCGTLEVPWTRLLIALDALEQGDYKWGRWKEATSLQRQFFKYLFVQRIPEARAALQSNSPDFHLNPLLFQILIDTRAKQAGDPKDKVIALYALCQELEIPLDRPDYALSLEDIYRHATRTAIEYDKTLYVLYHVPSDQRLESLPSWVPDWSEVGFESDDPRYGFLRNRFHASRSAPPRWSFSPDQKFLTLRGKVVDTIIYKTDAIPRTSSSNKLYTDDGDEAQARVRQEDLKQAIHDTRFIFRSWIEVSKWTDYPTGEPTRDALRRTLVMDNPDENAAAAANNTFDEWYERMTLPDLDLMALGIQNMGLDVDLPAEPHLREQVLVSMQDHVGAQTVSFMGLGFNAFTALALVRSAMKCLFYTEAAYFGTAPDPLPVSIQAGDKVVVVSGLEMPLVVRPVEGGYELVTHVYVHGMMYGEIWPAEESELEDIVLF